VSNFSVLLKGESNSIGGKDKTLVEARALRSVEILDGIRRIYCEEKKRRS
jgi:hypothetical protein